MWQRCVWESEYERDIDIWMRLDDEYYIITREDSSYMTENEEVDKMKICCEEW